MQPELLCNPPPSLGKEAATGQEVEAQIYAGDGEVGEEEERVGDLQSCCPPEERQ